LREQFVKDYAGKTYYCAVDLAFHLVGGKWKAVILWNLRNEPLRFSELKRVLVVINDRMLSKVLRELEHDNLIVRKDFGTVPPHVEYRLSENGETLLPILQQTEAWSKHLAE